MGRSHFSGPLTSRTQETDGGLFIPAQLWDFFTGTWTKTRAAAGNYFMRHTAANEAGQAVVPIGAMLLQKVGADPANIDSPHDIRGFEVNSVDVIYGVGTAALNAHTYDAHQATYANNVAVAILSTIGGTLTGTLATATQANPYVTTITFGTPYVVGLNTALRNAVLEISWNAALTSVLDYYGAYVNYHYNLL